VIEVFPVTYGRNTSSIGLTACCGAFSTVLDLFGLRIVQEVFAFIVAFSIFHIRQLEALPFLVVFEQIGRNQSNVISVCFISGTLFLNVVHRFLVDMNTLMDDGVNSCPRILNFFVREYHKDVGTRTICSTSKLFRKRGNLDFVPLAPILNFLLSCQTIPRRERGHFVPLHVCPSHQRPRHQQCVSCPGFVQFSWWQT
jgi:hypothetical protein